MSEGTQGVGFVEGDRRRVCDGQHLLCPALAKAGMAEVEILISSQGREW